MLRPRFTRRLADRLLHGEAINLTGNHGTGRRRTLADLASLLAGRATLLRTDMKYVANDYAAMLAGLADQSNVPLPRSLFELLERPTDNPQPIILILHNFDLLHGQPHDGRFDKELLPQLAALAARPGLGLLVVCEATYDDWPLPFSECPLPPLLQDANVNRHLCRRDD